MRVTNPAYVSGFSVTIGHDCGVRGCTEKTREGKPYCPEHVGRNPYARRLLKEIARRDAEDERMRSGSGSSSCNLQGITAQSILQDLHLNGTRTIERVCKDLRVDRAIVEGYVRQLVGLGLIRSGVTTRGSETLTISLSGVRHLDKTKV